MCHPERRAQPAVEPAGRCAASGSDTGCSPDILLRSSTHVSVIFAKKQSLRLALLGTSLYTREAAKVGTSSKTIIFCKKSRQNNRCFTQSMGQIRLPSVAGWCHMSQATSDGGIVKTSVNRPAGHRVQSRPCHPERRAQPAVEPAGRCAASGSTAGCSPAFACNVKASLPAAGRLALVYELFRSGFRTVSHRQPIFANASK